MKNMRIWNRIGCMMLTLVALIAIAVIAPVSVFAETTVSGEMTTPEHPWELENDGDDFVVDSPNHVVGVVENGKAEITLPDGTDITVFNCSNGVTSVVIYPFYEETSITAWNWFIKVLGDKHDEIVPIDIVFVDENYKAISYAEADVRMETPAGFDNSTVFAVDYDGNIDELDAVEIDGKVTFRADGEHYYILAENDNMYVLVMRIVNIAVAVVALFGGGTALGTLVVKKKNRSKNEDKRKKDELSDAETE